MTSERQLLIVAPDSNIVPTDEALESLLGELLVPEDFKGLGGMLKAAGISALNSYNPAAILERLQGKAPKAAKRAMILSLDSEVKALLIYLMRQLYQLDLPKMMPEAWVVSPASEALKNFQCSDGYFQPNVVYARHPVASDYYIKFAYFHKKLLEEKKKEFIQLLTSLGAKRIYLTSKNQQSKSSGATAKIDDPTNIANVGIGTTMGQSSLSDLKFDGEFGLPTTLPKVPDNLKWLKREDLWQTIVHGRQDGQWMKKYQVSFKYVESFGITSDLAAKLEGFGLSIGGNFSSMQILEEEYFVEFFSREEYEASGQL